MRKVGIKASRNPKNPLEFFKLLESPGITLNGNVLNFLLSSVRVDLNFFVPPLAALNRKIDLFAYKLG